MLGGRGLRHPPGPKVAVVLFGSNIDAETLRRGVNGAL